MTTLARRNDPRSSHEAAQYVEQSGVGARQSDLVLAALKEHNGDTSAEIGEVVELTNAQAGRRLSDLEREDKCHSGEPRRCRVKRRLMQTWWIGPKPTTQLEMF